MTIFLFKDPERKQIDSSFTFYAVVKREEEREREGAKEKKLNKIHTYIVATIRLYAHTFIT
jgi:hypothetical protein